MIRVGITGGIGCGKSTVVAEFARLGVAAFVADKVAAAYYNEPTFLSELRSLLGDEIIRNDGTADKAAIAARVFADKEALIALNGLVHPRVMRDFEYFCQQHLHDDYVLFESAILYEYGLEKHLDKVVCVYLDLEERLRRLRLRDHSTTEQLMARIANQMPAEAAMMRADYVVLNYDGNPRSRQVSIIDKMLRQ